MEQKQLIETDNLTTEQKGKAIIKHRQQRSTESWISDLVGAIFDPVILHQCGWIDLGVPEKLREQIRIQRLIELMVAQKEGREPTATDAECCAYFSIASMEFPFSRGWTNIYMYCFTKTFGKETPPDLRKDELEIDEVRDLKMFKDWIYGQRVKARKSKRKEVTEAEREAFEERKKEEQPLLIQ